MYEKSLVSIVVVNWNRKSELRNCLKSIMNQTYPRKEIIVVDNHSSDGSIEMIREEFPGIKLIIMPDSSYGACETFNIGIANARGDYIIIMDNDAIAEARDTVEKIVEKFERNPKLGIVSCMVYNYFSKKSECPPLTLNGPALPDTYYKYIDYQYMDFHGAGAGLRKSMLDPKLRLRGEYV